MILAAVPVHAGLTLNVQTAASHYATIHAATPVSVALTAGSGLNATTYTASDAAIVTAGLSVAGTYPVTFRQGTAGSAATSDVIVGVGLIGWDGDREVTADPTVLVNLDAPVSEAGSVIDGQPRINFEPDPAFTLTLSRRSDGTYKAGPGPIRLDPGTLSGKNQGAWIDMKQVFGPKMFVASVTEATTVSGGSITCTGEGPRDTFAFFKFAGTATAGEERTVTGFVTMANQVTIRVVFDVEVFGE